MPNYRRLFRNLLIVLGVCAGLLLLLFIAFYLMVEYGGKWSEKERRQFAEECAKTTVIDGLSISFIGFDYPEIDTVTIRQLHNGTCIDSFFVYVSAERYSYDSIRNQYHAYINRPLTITDSYHIIAHGVQTFILSDMEMVMWPQYTMFSEGWGCVMGSYTLNGVRFEHNTNPVLIKEGFDQPY